MLLTKLASKPQLVKVTLDSPEIVASYGESLDFFMYDRQDLDGFVRLASLDVKQFDQLAALMNNMILDQEGKAVVSDGLALPADVMMAAIQKVVEILGKPLASTSPTLTQS